MKRLLSIVTFAILFTCYSVASAQQRSDVMKELLSAPAPTPRTAGVATETATEPAPKVFDKAPPDDAPIEDLFQYWTPRRNDSGKNGPSDIVRQRLLDATLDNLEGLSTLLPLFRSSESYAEKIKQALDNSSDKPELEHSRKEIRKWLVFNSKYFLGELLSLANKVKDRTDYGSVENAEVLTALAKLDWSRAEPLLQTLSNTGQQRTSTLALRLLYEHSVDEKDATAELKFRTRLQSIAADKNFPGHARDTAIEALSMKEWSGRDDWYLSLITDESVISLHDGSYGFSPLGTVFNSDPDKWIPVMTKLVTGKDRAAQQAAASCLARYAIASPRRDAILPVLRWLTEPDWIPISGTERAWFMQKMADLDVPESIPGLIWIVENDEWNRQWAGRTLAHYKDARAIPALKKALAQSNDNERPMILEGLLASGGLTEIEQLNALEAYATKLTTASGREEVTSYRSRETLPLPVSIGLYLATMNNPPDTVVRAVLTRAGNLKKTNEAVSKSLLEIAHRWQGRQIDVDLIKRIGANTADANTIITALERRTALRESVPAELSSLLAASGEPQGIGAILLENNEMAAAILSSSDPAAQIGVLAAARLTQTPLPINLVGPLLKSKNALLATAAERYLLAEDSKEAQTLLREHHPNEAFITGWRENIELMGGDNFDQFGKGEDQLRAELLKPDGPVEIFAMLANNDHNSQVLRIYPDKAVYTFYEDATRYRERVVPKAELAVFRDFLSNNRVADLGPQIGPCHHNCWISEFVMLSRETGRRLFSHVAFDGPAMVIHANLERLGSGEGASTHYNFGKEIKGLEVLYADPRLEVKDVWQRGDEIRIFVEREETEDEKDKLRAAEASDDDVDITTTKYRQRELERLNARLSWRTLKDKDAGSITTAPEGYSKYDATRFPLDDGDAASRRNDEQVQLLDANTILLARNFDGLWKQTAGAKAVRISGEDGAYALPIVTPDGKWAVLAKTDNDWSKPNYLVRVNLETETEYRIKLEPADQFDPIRFLPLHGKILLRRAKDGPDDWSSANPVGPETPEYYLLDPKTGESQLVSGEFAPLRQDGKRFLQPADVPGEYWAAIPDHDKNQTRIGRYNLKDFSFKPVLTVPQISFDSMSMWVDEKQGKLYVVYKSQLLRLPLKSTP